SRVPELRERPEGRSAQSRRAAVPHDVFRGGDVLLISRGCFPKVLPLTGRYRYPRMAGSQSTPTGSGALRTRAPRFFFTGGGGPHIMETRGLRGGAGLSHWGSIL